MKRIIRRKGWELLLGILCAAWFIGVAVYKAHAQDCEPGSYGCGHQENHELYKDWKSDRNGGNCCNGKDCRPVLAYKDDEGDWRIFIPELKAITVEKRIIKGWLYVPPSQVNKPDKFHDGRSHACTSPVYPPNSEATKGFSYYILPDIYCFTPAQPKI